MSIGSATLAELAGVSLRQLQNWDETKVVRPQHEGHSRRYDSHLAFLVMVLGSLRNKGLSLQRLRAIVKPLAKQKNFEATEVVLLSGTQLYITTETRVIELASESPRPVYVVRLRPILEKLSAAKDPPRRVPVRSYVARVRTEPNPVVRIQRYK